MKNKILLKIEEFLQTNKNVLLLILSAIILLVLPMFVFGVKETVVGAVILIGTVFWLTVLIFLLHYVFEKITDIFEYISEKKS